MNTHRTAPIVRLGCFVALFLFFGVLALPRAGAGHIYAKFLDGTGVWSGESDKTGRKDWTDLTNLSFGGKTPSRLAAAAAPPPGGSHLMTSRSAKKWTGLLRRFLQTSLQAARSMPATRSAMSPSSSPANSWLATAKSPFLRVEYRLVYFTAQNSSTATGDSVVNDNITMTAGATRITYWPILANGSQGTPIIKSWSVVLNNNTFNIQ
jgi:hypothetical protein